MKCQNVGCGHDHSQHLDRVRMCLVMNCPCAQFTLEKTSRLLAELLESLVPEQEDELIKVLRPEQLAILAELIGALGRRPWLNFLAGRVSKKDAYVNFLRACEAGSEHTFVHETTNHLKLVGLIVSAPGGSVVLSINDGLNEVLLKPLPASVFSTRTLFYCKTSFVKPGAKQTVTIRCGEEFPGRVTDVRVVFIVTPGDEVVA